MSFTIPNQGAASFAQQAAPDTLDIAALAGSAGVTGVVSGCAVTANGTTLVLTVAAGVVQFRGQRVTVPGGTVTVAAADVTNPRRDIVTVSTAGTLAVTAGTAAAVTPAGGPVKPALPSSSVLLAEVYVPAGGTAALSTWLTDKGIVLYDHPFLAATAYGLVPDGTTDNTAALQAGVNAAQAFGLPLVLPAGTVISGSVTVAAGNLSVWGPGRENCTLKLKNGTNGYLFSFTPGTSGFITADFRDFGVNGNAENQTSGGCILAAGSVQSRFDNLHFQDAYDVCLWLYQNSSGGFGHHNRVTRCLFDTLNTVASANQQGIRCQASDENYIAFCDFENWGGLAATPGSEPYAIKDWSGLQQIIGNVFVGGQEAVRIQDSSSTRVIGNTFDGVGRAGLHPSGSKNVVMGNLFSNGSSTGAGSYAQCEIDNSSSCVVDGNVFAVTTSGQVRNCVREFSSSSVNTVVASNVIDLSGGSLFSTNKAVELHGGNSAARSNPGYNPVQTLAALAAPALTPGTPGTMTGGVYQVKTTLVTTDGETAASAAASATVAASGKLDVAAPVMTGNAKGWYAYVTIHGGSTFFRQQAAGSPVALNSGYTQTAEPSTSGATAPAGNTTAGVTTPSVPATTVLAQNTTGVDVMVAITAGAGTVAVTIGNTAIATIPASGVASFRLPAGQYIALAYASAPSWAWLGE